MTTEQVWIEVCAFDEVENPGSYAFELSTDQFPVPGFLVRQGEDVFAYVNICPHAGRHLQWAPHHFLTNDKKNIFCAAHGAVFEIETGLCVGGPCLGAKLRPLEAKTREGKIEVLTPALKH